MTKKWVRVDQKGYELTRVRVDQLHMLQSRFVYYDHKSFSDYTDSLVSAKRINTTLTIMVSLYDQFQLERKFSGIPVIIQFIKKDIEFLVILDNQNLFNFH